MSFLNLIYTPMTEGEFVGWYVCGACGEVFRRVISVEWHYTHTNCGEIMANELRVDQEIARIRQEEPRNG